MPATTLATPKSFRDLAPTITRQRLVVDIYTCKAFDPAAVVAFTKDYFRTTDLVAKEF